MLKIITTKSPHLLNSFNKVLRDVLLVKDEVIMKTGFNISTELDNDGAPRITQIRIYDGRHLSINGNNIPWDSEVKYLGITIDH